jgi:hypothetical protein
LVEEIKKPASASTTTEKDKVEEKKEAQVEDANAHLAGEAAYFMSSRRNLVWRETIDR